MNDAIDFDFSTITVNNLLVDKAGNDCIDFSYGYYIIKTAFVNNCNDKGLSVGEKSEAKVENIIINKTKIGIASKDSSIVKINNLDLIKTQNCFQVYKKKQEFNGSKLILKNHNCIGDYSIDKNSILQ